MIYSKKISNLIVVMTNFSKEYKEKIKYKNYREDSSQLKIIKEFDRILYELKNNNKLTYKKTNIFHLFKKPEPQTNLIKGLYIYGNVGRGKTFLMDLFFNYIKNNTIYTIKRQHFHHFMQDIHNRLNKIKLKQDPLKIIAKDIANESKIICLDEFFVSDITDAMLLYELLKYIINYNTIVVTTSNIVPDNLYKNGLQRARFLPAIDLINTNLSIIKIDDGIDFRRTTLINKQLFITPIDKSTNHKIIKLVKELSTNIEIVESGSIEINNRKIDFIMKSAEVIWFDFKELCESNRSQLDYIWLAKNYNVIALSNIPILDTFKENAARRFLLLIDELYDKRIALILSSEVNIEKIYTGKKISFEFQRLQSRLFEMQSESYLKSNNLHSDTKI